MKGRKPEPAHILKLRGSPLAKDRPEDKADSSMPEAPSYLDADSQEIWNEIAFQLHRDGLLKKLDGETVGRYCVLLSMWKAAHKLTDKEVGLGAKAGIITKLSPCIARLEADLGLCATARARIKVSDKPDTGKLDKYRSKRA